MKKLMLIVFLVLSISAFASDIFIGKWIYKTGEVFSAVTFYSTFCIIDRNAKEYYYEYNVKGNYVEIGGFGYIFTTNKNKQQIKLCPSFENGITLILQKR